MIDQIAELIIDEGKWLTASMSFALLILAILLYRQRHRGLSLERRILAAMNMFFGITIGTMAFGHLLAVTTKLLLGTLHGSFFLFYGIGIALAVPSWWLIHLTIGMAEDEQRRRSIKLNSWIAITLMALGVHNLPLAMPAVFNICYHLHTRRALGWAIVGFAAIINIGLYIGSLIFLASGQSFEQFRGIE